MSKVSYSSTNLYKIAALVIETGIQPDIINPVDDLVVFGFSGIPQEAIKKMEDKHLNVEVINFMQVHKDLKRAATSAKIEKRKGN